MKKMALGPFKNVSRLTLGITGTGVPRTIIKALQHTARPAAVQAITNLLDSAGGMRNFSEGAGPLRSFKLQSKTASVSWAFAPFRPVR